ncbi:hypothetical protein ES708_23062 [subsurface metagenome]
MPVRIQKVKFYSTDEIGDILGLGQETVRLYIHQGRIHGIKIGSHWHISQKSLNQFLETGDCKKAKELADRKTGYVKML